LGKASRLYRRCTELQRQIRVSFAILITIRKVTFYLSPAWVCEKTNG
jgi:hypothetical protein